MLVISMGLNTHEVYAANMLTYEFQNNYPEAPKKCIPGKFYDDENYVYFCDKSGKLCPKYCFVANDFDSYGNLVSHSGLAFTPGTLGVVIEMVEHIQCTYDKDDGVLVMSVEGGSNLGTSVSNFPPSKPCVER